ncbi:MAG TPA: hypothetical protein VGB76_12525 [Pyrinomonadaceae bacterium]|jgi:hypothetical protein
MLITITLFIAFAAIGWLATRIYKMQMEKRLGRKIEGEHELTSITSWMEASKDEKPPDER